MAPLTCLRAKPTTIPLRNAVIMEKQHFWSNEVAWNSSLEVPLRKHIFLYKTTLFSRKKQTIRLAIEVYRRVLSSLHSSLRHEPTLGIALGADGLRLAKGGGRRQQEESRGSPKQLANGQRVLLGTHCELRTRQTHWNGPCHGFFLSGYRAGLESGDRNSLASGALLQKRSRQVLAENGSKVSLNDDLTSNICLF